jgi:hypothetical protein
MTYLQGECSYKHADSDTVVYRSIAGPVSFSTSPLPRLEVHAARALWDREAGGDAARVAEPGLAELRET